MTLLVTLNTLSNDDLLIEKIKSKTFVVIIVIIIIIIVQLGLPS